MWKCGENPCGASFFYPHSNVKNREFLPNKKWTKKGEFCQVKLYTKCFSTFHRGCVKKGMISDFVVDIGSDIPNLIMQDRIRVFQDVLDLFAAVQDRCMVTAEFLADFRQGKM